MSQSKRELLALEPFPVDRGREPPGSVGAVAELTVYEKRTCSTCRRLSALLAERGVDADRVEFQVEGLTEDEVRSLLAKAGLRPAEALRRREPLVAELDLERPGVGDDGIVRRMAEHPELLQRPFVVRGDRAVLARPPERALELL